MPLQKIVLSLCDHSGVWSAPYRKRGYWILQVDLKLGQDVRLMRFPGPVHGILAAPPCTHFALSGAQYWEKKGDEALYEGLALVDACLRFVAVCKPAWWALENPVGRLSKWIGPPRWSFDPFQFAGWSEDPAKEAYTKRTLLWGNFQIPKKRVIKPVLGSLMIGKVRDPGQRSITPSGFARAFCEANP